MPKRRRGGQGSTGCTEAKDKAEIKALDAAMLVLGGLKALYSDGAHPGHFGEARAAIDKLDVRLPNLESALLELVASYRKARQIADAGHGGKPDAAAKQ